MNQMKGIEVVWQVEPVTQVDTLLEKYQSKGNENPLKRTDTSNLQEESITEGEINKEELPSFQISRSINRMATFSDLKIERIQTTPATDLFLELKQLKDSSKKSELLSMIVTQIAKGINRMDRRKFWKIFWSLEFKVGNGEYKKCLKMPCPCLGVIEKDAERTFSETNIFEKGSTGYTDLVSVLHAMSVYKQEITYIQGMNFIAGSLLDTFTPEESFWIFQFLIDDYKLRKMYTDNMPLLCLFSYQLRTLIEIHLPNVNTWLIDNSLGVDIFCPQWFLTLFSINDNRDLFYQWIDLLFITGTKALFQIALSLLEISYEEGHLENFNFDAVFPASQINQSALKSKSKGEKICKNALKFKVSNKLLKALEK